jgi:membrane-associated protein
MNLLDPQTLLMNLGTMAVFGAALIIFIETSTIIGSWLPGDSLLFLLGLSLATWLSDFPIYYAVPLVIVSAFLGAQVGYWVGKKVGPILFQKERRFFLNQKTVARTKEFTEKYGNRAVILSRFVPILRALVPMFSAIGEMPIKKFTQLNAISAVLWVASLMLGGFFLGQIPFVKEHIELMIILVVVITSLPLPLELLREYLAKRKLNKLQG